jgi:hypothetical protein
MLINLVPVRMEAPLEARLDGEVLTLQGQDVDLSTVAEGVTMPAEAFGSPYLLGEVRREKGEIIVTVLLPHAADAPEETRFPQPLRCKKAGALPLPPYLGAVSDTTGLPGPETD